MALKVLFTFVIGNFQHIFSYFFVSRIVLYIVSNNIMIPCYSCHNNYFVICIRDQINDLLLLLLLLLFCATNSSHC
jgi:hypothetical protein